MVNLVKASFVKAFVMHWFHVMKQQLSRGNGSTMSRCVASDEAGVP